MTNLAFKNEFMTAANMQDYSGACGDGALVTLHNVLFHADWTGSGARIVVRRGEQFQRLDIAINPAKNETKYTFWKSLPQDNGTPLPDMVVSKSALY